MTRKAIKRSTDSKAGNDSRISKPIRFELNSTAGFVNSKMFENTEAVLRMKVVAWLPLISSGAGATHTVAIPMNFPNKYSIGSGTAGGPTIFGTFPNVGTNYAAFAPAAFDCYRVFALRVTFVGRYGDNGSSATDVDEQIIYMSKDLDDMIVPTETIMLDKGLIPSPINQNLGQPQYTWLNPSREWLNAGSDGIPPSTATTSSTNLDPTIYRSIKVLIPNQLNTNFAGRLYAEWFLELKSLV
jgi:hypothetical protein